MSSYTNTHERAVPTSASCLTRPTMAHVCTWHFHGSEGVHTLCCAECPWMYVLGAPIEMSVRVTKSWDCGRSPRQPPISGSSVHLLYFASALQSYALRHRLPSAWIKSQTSWLRRKRWTGDSNLHRRLAPWRTVTVLYY